MNITFYSLSIFNIVCVCMFMESGGGGPFPHLGLARGMGRFVSWNYITAH